MAGWNASDAAEYAKLIDLGKPDLIEINGMTYCGATSGASNLTMKNVPYHEDVKKFGEALCTARLDLVSGRDAASTSTLTPTEVATIEEPGPKTGGTPRSAEYGLACEHAHSCCILLARKDPYLVDGKWHTWIDYEKFQELVASGEPFTSDQYMLPTPRWSVWGAEEGGFDPGETRVRKVRNHPGKEKRKARREREREYTTFSMLLDRFPRDHSRVLGCVFPEAVEHHLNRARRDGHGGLPASARRRTARRRFGSPPSSPPRSSRRRRSGR